MKRNTKLLALAGLVWLWFGLSAAAHAQFPGERRYDSLGLSLTRHQPPASRPLT